jgi:hypothetical protein
MNLFWMNGPRKCNTILIYCWNHVKLKLGSSHKATKFCWFLNQYSLECQNWCPHLILGCLTCQSLAMIFKSLCQIILGGVQFFELCFYSLEFVVYSGGWKNRGLVSVSDKTKVLHGSRGEHLPGKHEALNSNTSTTQKCNNNNKLVFSILFWLSKSCFFKDQLKFHCLLEFPL